MLFADVDAAEAEPRGLAQDVDGEVLVAVPVDAGAGAGVVAELALEQVRGAGGELHDVRAALEVAVGVGDGLAVLGRQQPGQRVRLLLGELEEARQDAGAAWAFQSVQARCASAAEVIAAVVSPRSASGTRAWTSPVSGSYTSGVRRAPRRGEGVQPEDLRQRCHARTAGPYPGDDVLGRLRVVDEPQPDRAATGGAAGGGGLYDDDVGLVAHIEAVGDPQGHRRLQPGGLCRVVDAGHLRAAAAAVTAHDDTARDRSGHCYPPDFRLDLIIIISSADAG